MGLLGSGQERGSGMVPANGIKITAASTKAHRSIYRCGSKRLEMNLLQRVPGGAAELE